MKKQVLVACLWAWAAVFCLAGTSAAVKFKYEDLGNLGGQIYFWGNKCGINDAGQVVGGSWTSSNELRAFLKSPGQAMQELPLFPDAYSAVATCINYSGLIGGYYDNGFIRGCKWEIGAGPGYRIIDPAIGYQGIDYSIVHLNDAGFLVGQGPNPYYPAHHAMVITPGGEYQDLAPSKPFSAAFGINDANTIVGSYTDIGSSSTAGIWTYSGGEFSGSTSLLGIPDSGATAINNQGQAVGYFNISGIPHGFLKSQGKDYQDLGPSTNPYSINDSGWIVGTSEAGACIWTPEVGLESLSSKIVNLPSGVTLDHACAINNRGEIAGSMLINGASGAFKLTPVAEMPSLLLLLLD